MTFLESTLLGILEGFTEFLPISSTGHLILFSHILKINENDFLSLFEIVIQFGAILAVLGVYFKEISTSMRIWINLFIAFLPSAIIGLLVGSWIKATLFQPIVVCLSLFIGGIVLVWLELRKQKNQFSNGDKVNIKLMLGIGFFQCLAFIPGVSRSAATILGGQLLGLKRDESVKFSFLLGVPTITAAGAYSLLKHPYQLSSIELQLLGVGLITSFVSAYFSIKFFLKLLERKAFLICGIYRIVLAASYFYFVL
ncbi:MAG: undecaprenyl-diphosphate phosphatase [Bacteriovoracaceae bacterium]|nr:undecaprenyl-diphosphate phosphatase [Bacteriovoracaceae bacterium]